jgi:hypothetical protein
VHHVVAAELGGRLAVGGVGADRVRIDAERAHAGPRGQHVFAARRKRQVRLERREHKIDLVRRGADAVDRGGLGGGERTLGGADERGALPRQHEEHAAVGRLGHQQAGGRRAVVVGQHNVRAGARPEQAHGAGILEAAQLVARRTGGVDDDARTHVERRRARIERVDGTHADHASGVVLSRSRTST